MKTKVLVFMGMVASGKSYLAEALVAKTGCTYFNSDTIRKQIAGLESNSRQWLVVDDGIYSPEMSRKTYDAMLENAKGAIAQGVPLVIIDGSYNKREERIRVKASLVGLCDLRFVYCYCAEDVAYRRMNIRQADVSAVSDGRPLIYRHQKQTYQQPDEFSGDELVRVNTDTKVESLVERLLAS